MQRRLALSLAATAAAVVVVGGIGVVANLGILSAANGEPVGQLDADNVAGLGGPVSTVGAASLDADPTTTEAPPPSEVVAGEGTTSAPGAANGPAPSGSTGSSGSGGQGVVPTPTAVPTTTAPVDNRGPGSIDDHGGRTGSGTSGSGSSGSGSGTSGSGSSGSGSGHYDD